MKLSSLTVHVLALTLAAVGLASTDRSPDRVPRVALGTFDSRAVAVAYVHSDAFEERLGALRAELERARGAGDRERVRELEEAGPALQRRIHEQGFGGAPIHDILAGVADALPRVAERSGVDVLVSEWSLAWRREGAETVDVTDALVALFEPDADTLRTIEELRREHPVPVEGLDHDDH